jgi:hypothetical protein
MSETTTASEQITEEVTSWPGVEAGYGKRGEWGFRVGTHEIGHLHGDRSAHFGLGRELGLRLREEGRVVDHPVFPGKPAMAARAIRDADDVRDVIAMMQLNYERIVERYGLPAETAA